MTFGELTNLCITNYEKDVADSTFIKTERNLKRPVLPLLAKRPINEVTPLEIQDCVDIWVKNLKYGRKMLGLVRNIYKYGIKFGYTATTPAESISAPRQKRELKSTKDFYSKQELQKFLGLVEQTGSIKKIALFRVLAFTGIRIGELQALTWDDFKDGTLDINKAVSRGYTGLEISVTKNKSSERLISLDEKTVAILNELHQTYPKSKLIFENSNGGIMPPPKPRKWLLSIIEGTNLQPIRIHGFRHTHASLLFDSGMTLKQVQYRLGHSDMKTTITVYTHITQTAIDDIGKKFSNFIDF